MADRRKAPAPQPVPLPARPPKRPPVEATTTEFSRGEHPTAPRGSVFNPFLFDATDAELQCWLLTALVVAGKQSHIQERKLQQFLALVGLRPGNEPFPILARMTRERVRTDLQRVAMGQYRRLTETFHSLPRAVASGQIDLRTCSREQLTEFPGIGLKTASFYLLYTRPGARIACLDTHILAWLAEREPDVPASTPQSLPTYLRWENRFLIECDASGLPPCELDFRIWLERKTARSGNPNIPPPPPARSLPRTNPQGVC